MSKLYSRLKGSGFLIVIIVFFGTVFSLISIVNHYNFRTWAWDLGLFNNAIYDYSHFRFNDCMLLLPEHEHFKNYLADHFSIFPMVISPLIWVFGSYTLLIVQIGGILFGSLGIYKIFELKFPHDRYMPLFAMIHFLSIWGMYSALAFDYHDNVMAAMFVPWFFFFFSNKQFSYAFIFLFLIAICKENMALWAGFISIGSGILFWRDKQQRSFAILFSIFSFLYFVAIVKIAIPSLNIETGKEYFHFNFETLGKNFSEAFLTIIMRPLYVFKILFTNHLSDSSLNDIKMNLHYMVLLSGGLFLIYKPQFLVMLIPIYAQKLFNDDWSKWGPSAQYSIEFVPVLTVAVFYSLSDLKHKIALRIIAGVCIFFSLVATAKLMDGYGDPYCPRDRLRFYSMDHFHRNFNVHGAHEILKAIPENAKVSASSSLASHLALRDFIYQFPYVGDADYIVLLDDGTKYPLTEKAFQESVSEFRKSPIWTLIDERNKILVFKKND